VLISADLTTMSAISLCQMLRKKGPLGGRLPIIITSLDRPLVEQRLEAFGAGAWDYIGYLQGIDELMLKLRVFIGAKRELDRPAGLVDQLTGLYNLAGVKRRGNELASMAYRHRDSLACVALAPVAIARPETAMGTGVLKALVRTLLRTTRHSDIIGRSDAGQFVVLAPGTDTPGATTLAERIAAAASRLLPTRSAGAPVLEFRAGIDAVRDARATRRKASDLVSAAFVALRHAEGDRSGHWLQTYARRAGRSG
jgi:PleD family two-component response regulator